MRTLLGIDLGTTGLKAAVFDLEGRLLGRGLAANEYLPGPPGWAEQDPRGWWGNCRLAIRAALEQAGVEAADVASIGVCGFHHCPVFLAADGEPARPSIVTHDSRLGASLEALRQSGKLQEIVRLSGSQVVTGHLPSIFYHVLENDPGALRVTRWLILAKDYIRYRLTGQVGTEICDATGTNLIAMPGQDWSDALCQLLQVPRDMLPPIGESSQVCGVVTREAAETTGLRPGTPVVYGGGDSHCALVGLGVVGSGQVGLLLGTNSTLRASFDGFVVVGDRSAWVQQHVVPGRFTVSASSMAGSSVLAWFKELCREGLPPGDTYEELESLAAGAPPGSDGLLFHPYLFGERSPFYNPGARGAFLAVAHYHGKGHFVRSVLEGVAFCIANCFDTLQAIARERGERLSVVRTGESGGSRLPAWRQIIANALEQPIEVVSMQEPGCLGAALLAGVGIGAFPDISTAAGAAMSVSEVLLPDIGVSKLYRERRNVFNDAYLALEAILY